MVGGGAVFGPSFGKTGSGQDLFLGWVPGGDQLWDSFLQL